MKTSKTILMILVLWMLSVPALRAQWYGGIEGGVPFGMSSFSSFGADKTRAGYALGLFGGYRFTSVLSAECSAKWGKTNLAARDCCAEGGYWLGTDRMTYHAPWPVWTEPTMPAQRLRWPTPSITPKA